MGMSAPGLIVPSHVILPPILGAITAIAIIKAAVVVTIEEAVAVTIEAAVAVTIVCTVPGEAILMTDSTEATSDRGLIHGTLLTPDHLGDISTGHDLHLSLADEVAKDFVELLNMFLIYLTP